MTSAADTARVEPFEDIGRQRAAITFATWMFLATEMVLFGGLFAAYTVYRVEDPAGFAAAGRQTNVVIGAVNTVVMLTSGATMALGVELVRAGSRRAGAWCMAATAALGAGFLALKAVEYVEDFANGLFPGPAFALPERGAELFFSLYFMMTGLHAVHLVIGIAIVTFAAIATARDPAARGRDGTLGAVGLYWSFIDVVWAFIFPVLYLVGRAQ